MARQRRNQSILFSLTSLWARYFLMETVKVLLFFIICFYGLYVLIDFSSHASHYHHIRFRIIEMTQYYFADFIKRIDVLLPFALLISTIKTLCHLNVNNELVALMANGISLKTLLRPFLFLGLICTLLIYINTEWFYPKASGVINKIDASHSSQKNKHRGIPTVQHMLLEDGSTVLFHHFDPAKQMFADAYWIRTLDEIYRFKSLFPYADVPTGQFVDHFSRDSTGKLVVIDSHPHKILPDMRFNKTALRETLTPVEDLSLSQIHEKRPQKGEMLTEKDAQLLSTFFYKLAMPWLCFLAVIAPIPFCVRYTRQLPIFFIYAGCIFGLVAFYLIIDASLVLGKRQVLDPLWAICTPFALFFGFFSYRYIKLA